MLTTRYNNKFNPKRRIRDKSQTDGGFLENLSSNVEYGGNPQHKKKPGDFGLKPPSDPRQAKSLCDEVKIFRRSEAKDLLIDGIRHGLISEKMDDSQKFPKNIWSVVVMANGVKVPLESQLENPEKGTYHGYPLQKSDPMYSEVLKRW